MNDLAEIHTLIRSLCLPSKLEPVRVAGMLNRRLRLMEENASHVVFELQGQAATPWSRVELRWGKGRPGCFLLMEVDLTLAIPIEEILPLWKDLPMSVLPEDADAPVRSTLYLHQVPVGELRLISQDVAGRSVLSAVAVDEFPMIAWPR